MTDKQSVLSECEIYEHQVSGKTPKYTSGDRNYIFKALSHKQSQFFRALQQIHTVHPFYHLSKFIPVFVDRSEIQLSTTINSATENNSKKSHRQEWIDHISTREAGKKEKDKQFIKLQNLTKTFIQPNILDIKLGNKRFKIGNKKFEKSTTGSHQFRINGMLNWYANKQEHFMSKYYGQSITLAEIEAHLAFFFFDGKQIDAVMLQHICNRVKELILALKGSVGIKFTSSSLFVSYDAQHHGRYTVNFIDFDQWVEVPGTDQESIDGVSNVLYFLLEIIKKKDHYSEQLRNQELRFLKDPPEQVIPQKKKTENSYKF